MLDPGLEAKIRGAYRDPELAVLEGFHALKHALRFGAVIELAVTADPEAIDRLARDHAPDLRERLHALLEPVTMADLARVARGSLASPVLAVARRPAPLHHLLRDGRPVLLLESPSHLGNLGACVRTAAGLGAAAVWTIGGPSPWHPTALRGSAGLHFALPVLAITGLPALPADRPLLAFDPEGVPLSAEIDLDGAILAFGTERGGLSESLKARAERLLAIPMEPLVSSLNLATSVAIALWHWRARKR